MDQTKFKFITIMLKLILFLYEENKMLVLQKER